jgi:drug/metabolite transporter (DMT)-like permease
MYKSPAQQKQQAIAWIMLCLLMFSTGDALAKWLGQTFPVMGAVWLRYLIPTAMYTSILLYKRGWRLAPTTRPVIQLIRGVCLVISTACFWTALKYLPLAEAAAVAFIGPSLVIIISSLVLGEHARPVHIVSLVLGFVGVLIVLRPGFSNPGIGAIASMLSALMYSIYQVLTRQISMEDPEHADLLTQLFYANAVGAIVLSTFVPFSDATWRMPNTLEWAGILLMIALSTVGHVSITRAYSMASAPTLAPFMYTQLLFTTIHGFVWFKHLPDGLTLLGMAVIVGSGLIVLFDAREHGKEEPPPNQTPE